MMEHFHHETIGENWFTYPTLYTSMVDRFDSPAKFVEVGVWKGRSVAYMAVEIANSNKKIDFYAVDTWDGTSPETDPSNIDNLPELQQNPEWLYELFLSNIKPVKDYIIPLRMFSLEAAEQFEDESLDFVFIDASHDYENVKADILAWLPKMKKTGVLAGHDYEGEVQRAVDDVFSSFKITVPDHRCWMYDLNKWEND